MPIYEYACEACGNRLEAIQKFSDAPLTDCPSCGKSTLKKLISAAGFHLKGGGWYATESRAPEKSATAEKSKESSGSDSGTTSGGCGSGGCGCC